MTPISVRRESAREMCIFIARFISKGSRLKSNTGKNGEPIKVGNKVFYEDNSGNWVF